MAFKITGDTHGNVLSRLLEMNLAAGDCVIVLGDVGLNFYLDKMDENNKKEVNDFLTECDCWLYCVRGNHEEHPETLGYNRFTDPQVEGEVYIQTDYSRIRYFIDGGQYNIEGHKTLVIGGAYSIDKHHRIANYMQPDGWCGWFADEQLTEKERDEIFNKVKGKSYDLVLTHTFPIDWQPIDLFLPQVNQSTVDNTTELWLQEVMENISWNVWLGGHFHADQLLRPHVEMYYTNTEKLDTIFDRWERYDKTGELDWWLAKNSYFYAN